MFRRNNFVATKKPQVPNFLKIGKTTKPPHSGFLNVCKIKRTFPFQFFECLQNQKFPPMPSFSKFSKELGISTEEMMENPPIRV